MSSVFISYSHLDKPQATILAKYLSDNGHTVFHDAELSAGDKWQAELSNNLAKSEIFIILLSHNSVLSSYPMAEVGRALGRSENEDILILPITIDNVEIPTILQDRQVLRADNDLEVYLPQVLAAISAFESRQKEKRNRQKKVEDDLGTFVDEAIKQQQDYESKNKWWARFWQFFGVASLSLIAISALIQAKMVNSATTPETINLIQVAALAIANIVLIGAMAALARYAYSLSASYMSEALKSSDRIHAILFGKFFLKAYGNRLSPDEVKDAFQHWNIDRNSNFSKLDPSQIDPQIYALISQLVGAISSRKKA